MQREIIRFLNNQRLMNCHKYWNANELSKELKLNTKQTYTQLNNLLEYGFIEIDLNNYPPKSVRIKDKYISKDIYS